MQLVYGATPDAYLVLVVRRPVSSLLGFKKDVQVETTELSMVEAISLYQSIHAMVVNRSTTDTENADGGIVSLDSERAQRLTPPQ